MKNNYIGHIFLNLTIILAAFVIFVFFDINVSKANQIMNNSDIDKNIEINKNQSNNESNVKTPYDYENILPFDWNTNHYIDYNVLNDETNSRVIGNGSNPETAIVFYPVKKAYYRFEIPRFILSGDVNPQKAYIRIFHDDEITPCFMGPTNILFNKDENGNYTASWFYGWNPPVGEYKAILYINNDALLTNHFQIVQRQPVKFNRMMSFVNLEWNQSITNRNIYDHYDNKVKFISGLKDWMNYGEIDGFLTLSGETTGWGNITPDKPWEYYPIKNLQMIGEEIHNHKKMVGAYIMCFYTPQNGWIKSGYQPAKGIAYNSENDNYNVVSGKFISFKDKKRFDDIVNLARYFNGLPYVDFIGFDFIRFGEMLGYENVDEFIHDMNVDVPPKWNNYSLDDKIIWLGIKLGHTSSLSISQKWKAWIAHKTADFIYRVRKEANLTKPIWVFTLGWNHGSEHGQDPYFFQDAGAFSDFVMLYEATPDMIEGMRKSWSEYVYNENLNYIPGNQIDSDLLKSLYNNNPVEEYNQRLNTGIDYAPYLSKGLFIHDISRAFWGKKGGYSYYEWLISGFSSISYARWQNNEIPFKMEILTDRIMENTDNGYTIPVSIDILKDKITELSNKELMLEVVGNNSIKKIDISEKTNIILDINISSHMVRSNRYFALRSKIEGYPAYFVFGYLNNKK